MALAHFLAPDSSPIALREPAPAQAPTAVRQGRALVISVLVGCLAAGVLVAGRTAAAFTGSTVNPGSSWSAGTVTISDDDSANVLFTESELTPTQPFEQCIRVTYDGTVAAAVKLFAANGSGALTPYLNLKIEQADDATNLGGYSGCAGFSGTQIYSGTVANLLATTTTYSSGVGSFAPTGAGNYRVYRFSGSIDAAAPNSLQGSALSVEFTWEAQT